MATLQARITSLAQAIRDKINLMMPRLLPTGGAAGAPLVKTTASDYAVGWGKREWVMDSLTTDASGLRTITYPVALSVKPFVIGQVDQASSGSPRATAVEILDRTATGCTVKTYRHAVTGVLIGGSVPGMEVYPNAAFSLHIREA
uniref:Tail protein n=1 Tax=Caulobacter phage BL57 TaxID=3348355 RepID=A0AB74UML1_9VIRU